MRAPNPRSMKVGSRRKTRWMATQMRTEIKVFPGPPRVLVMDAMPGIRRQGADSPHQLPLLIHGRGTATSVKWTV